MQMTFRWFGGDKDTVSLEQIRQIPGVVGVVPALHYLPAGEAWPLADIFQMKAEYRELQREHPQPLESGRKGDLLQLHARV